VYSDRSARSDPIARFLLKGQKTFCLERKNVVYPRSKAGADAGFQEEEPAIRDIPFSRRTLAPGVSVSRLKASLREALRATKLAVANDIPFYSRGRRSRIRKRVFSAFFYEL